MDYIRVGLFIISKIKGLVNYELELLIDAKIYLVFYILFLKKANPNILVITQFQYKTKKENIFEIKKILKQKGNQYFIK